MRRVILAGLVAAVLVVPGVGSSAVPRPTRGVAHVGLCGIYQCPNDPPDIQRGFYSFMGAVALDNGSYSGTFAVPFVAHRVCATSELCSFRFTNAPVEAPSTFYEDDLLGVVNLNFQSGPVMTGSCSGTFVVGFAISQLSCYFKTSGGIKGNRRLLVAVVDDPPAFVCSELCNGGGPPNGPFLTGVYVQRDASLPS